MHEIVRPAVLINQPDSTLLTNEQIIFLQELVDHDIFPYILLAIVILLFVSTTCCKITCVPDFFKKLGCFIPICRNKHSNSKDARSFEVEELMGAKEYATIFKSPKVSRNIQIPVNTMDDLPLEKAYIKTIKLYMSQATG